MKEDSVEIAIKLFQFIGDERRYVRHLLHFVYHSGFNFPVYVLSIFIQFADIVGTDIKYITDIFFFDIVRFRQLGIGFLKLAV